MLLYKGHEYQGWNKDKHKLFFFSAMPPAGSTETFLSRLAGLPRAIMATESCRYRLLIACLLSHKLLCHNRP